MVATATVLVLVLLQRSLSLSYYQDDALWSQQSSWFPQDIVATIDRESYLGQSCAASLPDDYIATFGLFAAVPTSLGNVFAMGCAEHNTYGELMALQHRTSDGVTVVRSTCEAPCELPPGTSESAWVWFAVLGRLLSVPGWGSGWPGACTTCAGRDKSSRCGSPHAVPLCRHAGSVQLRQHCMD